MVRYGYWTDLFGATRKVQIVGEVDRKFYISHPSFTCFGTGAILVPQEEVKDIWEEE